MSDRLQALFNFYEKDPKDSFVIYGIALEYISQKNYEKGEEYLKLLINQDPDYVAAYMQYARLKENLNEMEEAKNIYHKGIEAAKKVGDKHAITEMEDFLNELE